MPAAPGGGTRWLLWIVVALIAVALITYLLR
jgi:hypothetical protein